MSTDPYGQWTGTPMDEGDAEDLLNAAEWGVLALAEGDEPYSIPVSYGYAGGDVYFAFVRSDPSNAKFEFIDRGKTARLLVTDIRAKYYWQSVAVTGPVSAVRRREDLGGEGLLPEVDRKPDADTDWERLLAALEDNAWFSSEFESDDAVTALQGWRLEPESVHGVEVREE